MWEVIKCHQFGRCSSTVLPWWLHWKLRMFCQLCLISHVSTLSGPDIFSVAFVPLEPFSSSFFSSFSSCQATQWSKNKQKLFLAKRHPKKKRAGRCGSALFHTCPFKFSRFILSYPIHLSSIFKFSPASSQASYHVWCLCHSSHQHEASLAKI